MKKRAKKIPMIFFALLFFSVNLYSNEGRIDFEGMEASRKAAMKKISKTHLIYMDLKVMFPDPKLRALAKAAGKGNVSKINSLVSDGVNVNARGNRNATVLFWALKKANLEGYTRLLEMGADPNVVFDDGGSVMHWAPRMKASSEKNQFLIRALQHGGDSNLRAGRLGETPLFKSLSLHRAVKDNTNSFDILVNARADINLQNNNGYTPMMVAAALDRFDMVYKLLILGADHTIKDVYGTTVFDSVLKSEKVLNKDSETYDWMKKVKVILMNKDRERNPE